MSRYLGTHKSWEPGPEEERRGTGTWGLGAFREDCMIGAVNIGMETQPYQPINQE